jgi:1-acyl-sn-glycerol-3-phosphate acyltransferase
MAYPITQSETEIILKQKLIMEEIEKAIDLEKAIRNSNSSFLKSLPGFVVRILKKIVRQNELNSAIYRSRHLQGIPFINDILAGWNVNVFSKGIGNIPASGRFIFVANHPVGGMDALAFFSSAGRVCPKIISPSNQILSIIPNIRELMVGLNVFGRQTKETAAKLHQLFESDSQILIFPAGEVSRKTKGKIGDPVWQKTFISKAIEHKRDIIPAHISGRNSGFFYFIANLRKFLRIKMFIETILLPGEMMKLRGKPMTVTFGKPIPWQTFTNEITHTEWAQKVKEIVYSLPGNEKPDL